MIIGCLRSSIPAVNHSNQPAHRKNNLVFPLPCGFDSYYKLHYRHPKHHSSTGITTHDAKLQRGLDPTDKASRVASYQHNLVHEVGIISHSCGVRSPRDLKRFHAREVQENGRSIALDDLHPSPQARKQAA